MTFPILRMIELPEIKVDRHEQPDASAPTAAAARARTGSRPAAIAIAVFDATGKQPRRLPLTPKYMKNLLATLEH